MTTNLFDIDGNVVATMSWEVETPQSIVYGTRLFQRQTDGRYVEVVPGQQTVLPAIHVPIIRRNEDPSF